MKKSISYLFASLTCLALLASCYKQDDIYKEFVKPGGYIYPAKPVNLVAIAGHSRVVLQWELSQDPAVKSAKVFWDNYAKSCDVDYSKYPEGLVAVEVKDLEDRSYTFDVVNFDGNGNKSLASEITASAYGDSWLVTHSERYLLSAEMQGTSAHVSLSRSTDEMVATRFRYLNTKGEWVDYNVYMKPDEMEFDLPDAMRGKKFEFKSGFCPENGLDTVWNTSWIRSAQGILYKLDTKDWKVSVTKDQVNGSFTPEKIFDGIVNQPANRWHSSTNASIRKNFPKVLAIDTGLAEGHEATLCGYAFWEHPESQSYRYIKSVSMYVGDAPFNPDDADFQNTYADCYSGKMMLSKSEQMQKGTLSTRLSGRYMAVVFIDSYNTNGYIDLWEYEPIGYIEAESE